MNFVEEFCEELEKKAAAEAKSGKRMGFSKLKNKLSQEPGVRDPEGLAAYIGRKKYGKKEI